MNADEAFVQALDAFGRERLLYGAGLALVAGVAGLLIWEAVRGTRTAHQRAQAQQPSAAQRNAFASWGTDYGHLNS